MIYLYTWFNLPVHFEQTLKDSLHSQQLSNTVGFICRGTTQVDKPSLLQREDRRRRSLGWNTKASFSLCRCCCFPGSPLSQSSLPAQSGNPPLAAAQTVHLRGSLPQQVCSTQPPTELLELRLKIGAADRELKWLNKRWEPEEEEDKKDAIAAQARHPQSNLSRPGEERRRLDNASISLRVLRCKWSTLGHAIYWNILTHQTKKKKKKEERKKEKVGQRLTHRCRRDKQMSSWSLRWA